MIKALARFFFLVGDGGNVKETALDIINQIIGDKNTTSLDIDQLTDERYLNSIAGKLVNLGDDVKDKPIDEKKMKILKYVATADKVEVRKLYKDAQSMRLTSTLIFTSNHILKSFEKGKSFKRRVLWLPMYTEVKKADPSFILSVTNEEALEYWISLVVDAYKRLYINKKFTSSKIVEEFNTQYHIDNDNTLENFSDLTVDDVIGKRSPEVYEQYEAWATENGLNVQSRKLLINNIKEMLGVEIVPEFLNGKTAKVFQPVNITKTG